MTDTPGVLLLALRAIHFTKIFLRAKIVSQIISLYFERFVSYLVSSLTMLEKYLKIQHYLAFWWRWLGGETYTSICFYLSPIKSYKSFKNTQKYDILVFGLMRDTLRRYGISYISYHIVISSAPITIKRT